MLKSVYVLCYLLKICVECLQNHLLQNFFRVSALSGVEKGKGGKDAFIKSRALFAQLCTFYVRICVMISALVSYFLHVVTYQSSYYCYLNTDAKLMAVRFFL